MSAKEIRAELSAIRETAGDFWQDETDDCAVSAAKTAGAGTLGGIAYERRKGAYP